MVNCRYKTCPNYDRRVAGNCKGIDIWSPFDCQRYRRRILIELTIIAVVAVTLFLSVSVPAPTASGTDRPISGPVR